MFNPWWLFIKGISIKHFEEAGKEILALRMITFTYPHLHELDRSVGNYDGFIVLLKNYFQWEAGACVNLIQTESLAG